MTTADQLATELVFLLPENPSRLQSESPAFGLAHVFYTEAKEHTCAAALLLEMAV